METGLLHLHGFLPWAVLLLLLAVIGKSFAGWFGGSNYTKGDRTLTTVTIIATHLQVVLGVVLYFMRQVPIISEGGMGSVMKEAPLRLMALEHPVTMLLAAVLITIGSSKAKRATEDKAKFKTQAIFMTIGLVLILSRFPWDRFLG